MLGAFGRMSAEKALRRVKFFRSTIVDQRYAVLRFCSSESRVSIGDVSTVIVKPKRPELVPVKYLPEDAPQSVMKHLRWIMQKDLLGQDVFLIGPPGPHRRAVAMMYLELTNRECEYVSLSRDTTETDLKQRREIRSGTAYYIDQCAVRAATDGRILVLEGIEKAERNVLPVLNNLLENREMQLDDGRFLMAADRYDKLLKEHTQEELDAWKLVRVDERFRVIALGLPVPRYQGNPLDPPLRSRFQARDVHPLPFSEQLESLGVAGGEVPQERISQVLGFASTMTSSESSSLGLPDFPLSSLDGVIHILNAMPSSSLHNLVSRLYPYEVMLGKEGRTAVADTFQRFNIPLRQSDVNHVSKVTLHNNNAEAQISAGGVKYNIQVPKGYKTEQHVSDHFIQTPYHDSLLADMLQSHMVKDFCVIGPKGCGKSALVKQFGDLLGYHVEPIMLYQDMTSRDLLQQRTTLTNGDTVWQPSPLVEAALGGQLAVLDGVHRINPGTFAVLHRLVHDRELSLFDGTRLLRQDRYDQVKQTTGMTDDQMAEKAIFPIHPAFRIAALAEPPPVGSSTGQWLGSELLTMFLYHHMRALTAAEETLLIKKIVPHAPDMTPLLNLTHHLRSSTDATMQSLSSSLSTRQLLRIARRQAQFPTGCLYDAVQKACLARFLPRLAKNALEQALEQFGIVPMETSHSVDSIERAVTCEIKEGMLRIGETEAEVFNPENKMKVPDVLFYENAQHLSIMEAMLQDYLLGEHLLLVGNQGVGKNKIVDRFLHLLNKPREYLQLHRDTTVQTLTLQPTVRDGVIIYEDSPLVRAAKHGHILVVDEADKAPTHVTCILKTLVESGEMHLADGRRIVSADSGLPPSDNLIVIHPNFRMMVLANRPGFPFLGNDFFGAMGDIFSCHGVHNPDMESEMSMLRQYGPAVPDTILKKLVLAFGELRSQADQGLIAYPYSTREVVNIVKHLQKFPDEGVASVVRNVFDFDSYNPEMKETIVETLHKHGIPVGARPGNVNLAKDFPLPQFELAASWKVAFKGTRKGSGLISLPVSAKPLSVKGPVRFNIQSHLLDKVETRSSHFSEQSVYWQLPLQDANIVADVAVTRGGVRDRRQQEDVIHIATARPIKLYTMKPSSRYISCIDLYDLFPTTRGMYTPRVRVAPLGASLYDTVVLHEEKSNVLLSINTETGDVMRLAMDSLLETASHKLFGRSEQDMYTLCRSLSGTPDGLLILYKSRSQSIEVLNMLLGICHSIAVPFKIGGVHPVATDQWMVTEYDNNRKYMLRSSGEGSNTEYFLHPVTEEDTTAGVGRLELMSTSPLSEASLSAVLGTSISSENRVLATPATYASVAVGLPDLHSIEVYSAPRQPSTKAEREIGGDFMLQLLSKPPTPNADSKIAYLPVCGQVVRSMQYWQVPKEAIPEGSTQQMVSGYLEVTDPVNHVLRYIPVPRPSMNSLQYYPWSDVDIVMAAMSNDGLVTVDLTGIVRLWETAPAQLARSLDQWRKMIGSGEGRNLQITRERDSGKDVEGPKHGKVDPKNAPHVGGNTWAGGTGGRDTAGLGGKGGPYRLDAGHDVYQISEEEKEAVPEEVKRAAREMGQKAFQERLREIQMSEYDAKFYEGYSKAVRKQVQSLRVVLDSLQAKGKERQWLKNQTYGDLDDAKLIEGLTGERSIYKRRGEKEPEQGSPQQKPKRLKLVVDVSGSMYRFDGHDGRLDREMEAVTMVMEAFEGYEHKFKYDIVGHSGDGYNIQFMSGGRVPANNKQRLDILKTMVAHSQFCISGDHTLEATKHAIETLAEEEADEHFVIVLSDANLGRYGIGPKSFTNVLMSDDKVNTFAIFIGSLGDQAQRLAAFL
ncbi:von Willebrand factor A domain-containing protein 8 [Lingula anatina]|uniref:von Willebrand factor A domain-containing protein 8 n=1 Tax=Lingula anatina TaxID=7574 RepID=A0A2R2MIY4_LINAN|nr:von Willebrand factor A domain-containing protein 8 [Lingula anatina]|eukprot:XP_023930017.1 von Willebrand factor A domain-containing protein 8 [Lingula anatina]